MSPRPPTVASDIACVVLALLVLALLGFIGWQAGWWLQGIGGTAVNPTMT